MPTEDATTAASLPAAVVWFGKTLELAISTQWVVLILVPVLTMLGAIVFKRSARKVRTIQPADWVFGFDLGLTACLTLVVSGFVLLNNSVSKVTPQERQHYIVGLFIVLAMFLGALSFGASMMHKFGWDDAASDKPKGRVHYWINGGGIVLLVIAFVLTGGTFR